MQETALASALRRDRWIVVVALLVITALALGYTYWLATGFDMSGMMSPDYVPWSAGYFAFMLVMWIVMMIGMMTPSVAPMILLYAAIARQNSARPCLRATRLVSRRLPDCVGGIRDAGHAVAMVPRMAGTRHTDDGGYQSRAGRCHAGRCGHLSMAASQAGLPGFVQYAAVVRATARAASSRALAARCSSAFSHGFYCIGCCWTLMLLLFAFGVMNLTWIAGLMIFVLLEKTLPWPVVVSRLAGTAAIVAGVMLIAT